MTAPRAERKQPPQGEWYLRSAEDVLTQLDSLTSGLSLAEAARRLATTSSAIKNDALHRIAEVLVSEQAAILAANREDVERSRADGLSDYKLDRLMLDESRIAAIEKDCLDLEGLAIAFILPNHLFGPCNECIRVAGTGLELLHMDMDVDAVVLPRHAGE